MGFYFDMAQTNIAGWHTFDAAALILLVLGKYLAQDDLSKSSPDGVIVKLVDTTDGNKVVASDVLIHQNGRIGLKDLTKDTMVASLGQMAAMPEDLQAALYPYEQIPEGRRP